MATSFSYQEPVSKKLTSEEELQEVLNTQRKRLFSFFKQYNKSNRILINFSLILTLAGLLFIIGSIVSVLVTHNSIFTFTLAIAGVLISVIGALYFRQVNQEAVEIRNTYLENTLELEKLSQALQLMSKVDDDTKIHLTELLIEELLDAEPRKRETQIKSKMASLEENAPSISNKPKGV